MNALQNANIIGGEGRIVVLAIVLVTVCFIATGGGMSSGTSRGLVGSGKSIIKVMEPHVYKPANVEKFVMENAQALGYDTPEGTTSSGCKMWNDDKSPYANELQAFVKELEEYAKRAREFNSPVTDLRLHLDENDVCSKLELDSNGLMGIFRSSQLSLSSTGYVEPILPPLRHPAFCPGFKPQKGGVDLSYLVHDFSAICRSLKRTSRTIMINMGASLEFNLDPGDTSSELYLIDLFRRFGMPFDHIYAFEITPTPPERVFQDLPAHLMSSYHWINVGVESDPQSKLNPLKLLLDNFNEDDFVVVKLDIDTPDIEMPLARQLLEDERFSRLVDHFYFEHHVHLEELAPYWKNTMRGSVKDSLDLFYGMRQKGIAAHSWV
mmetsp:Transcript_48621/g.146606  ORF Transcript_48621/g.146606 Transcript_48621/m.146606 type:complete len:379 (-) Transcript_48621:86-1222(-)|eukprot:CAMPEP_0113566396 /NCGR_PEP_ID=MMETSP0015_2-20120614/22698_1 /TAXON_ID=2838 /ORGANISM="Odontella" /LENGTH=378 /DNA_ID=CAMNT_0000468677 /DNA_START=80 /DNA_END=1216 /DNA_ORIENTATION=- /assembly_acc=CAM_ASM_000160